MRRRFITVFCAAALACAMLTGCGGNAGEEAEDKQTVEAEKETDKEAGKEAEKEAKKAEETGGEKEAGTVTELADGVYRAEFDTDSSMFHVNEAKEGKGVLTVEGGKMTIHVSLVSKNIVNLFVGTAEDAEKEGAEIIEPTTDTITYSDGMTEEVYGFDIPVPVIGEEFDVALLGTKGKWYDHKVSVTNPYTLSDSQPQ